MYRAFVLVLVVVTCAFIQISSIVADEPTVSPQWEERFYYYPRWQALYVGMQAYFDVYLYDQEGYSIANALIQFKVIEGPHTGACGSDRTDVYGYAGLSYVGSLTGRDKVLIWYDKDENSEWDWEAEPGGFAYVEWYSGWDYYFYFGWYGTPIIGNTVYLCVNLYDGFWNYVPNVLIRFLVFDGPNKGVSGSVYTNEYGYAEFPYTGTGGIGEDDVLAYADFNENGVWDWQGEEPGDIVQIYWYLPYLWGDPYAASPPVGNEMYIEAHVEDFEESGIGYGRYSIVFEVISGPNVGLKQIVETDDAGIAPFTYMGNVVGEDQVKVYFEDYPDSDYVIVCVFWMERLKFAKYELVSSQWNPPYYIAELRAWINNPTEVPPGLSTSDFTVYNVTAVISEVPQWVEVIDGELTFGETQYIEPGETVPSYDTFTIKVDTKKVKDPKQGIKWTVMYFDPWRNLHVIANVQQLK